MGNLHPGYFTPQDDNSTRCSRRGFACRVLWDPEAYVSVMSGSSPIVQS
jgi:hypothetical protein